MVTLPPVQSGAALTPERMQETASSASSWLPGFWPFPSSSPGGTGGVRATSYAGSVVGAIQSVWTRNITPKSPLQEHLQDTRKIDDQMRGPIQTTDQPVDWKAQTNENVEQFIRILSLSQTLEWMHPNLEPNTAAQILKEATTTNRSLCSIYLEKKGNELSFFSALVIKIFYFFLYDCGVIPNIVESSVKAILEKIRFGLVQKDGGKNLTALTSTILKQLNSFLSDYLKALKEYADGTGSGSRDDYLNDQLQRELDGICREFSDVLVGEFLPTHISFFQKWKESPYLIVRLLTKILAHFPEIGLTSYIRTKLREQIPAAIQTQINEKTVQEDQRRDLLFSTAITNGIIGQLQKLQSQLKQSQIPTAPVGQIPGTELLPTVVTQLLEVSRLDPCKTREQLLQQLNKQKPFYDYDITPQLEASLVDGCREFFSYFTDPTHSEEFFSELLTLVTDQYTSTAPVTDKEWKTAQKEYEQVYDEMLENAGEIFRAISRDSVAKKMQGLPEEIENLLAEQFCQEEQNLWKKTADLLQNTIAGMEKKIADIPLSGTLTPLPAPDKAILDDLEQLRAQIISRRSSLLSHLKEIESFPSSIQRGIETSIDPLVQHLNLLLNQVNKLKEIQQRLTDESLVANSLEMLKDAHAHYTSLQKLDEFSKLWPVYDTAIEQLKKAKKETAPVAEYRKELEETHLHLQTEMRIVRNLYSLGQDNGLLSQCALALDENLREPSLLFSSRKLRAQIAILCQALPDAEKEELLHIVDAMRNAKSIPALREHWKELKARLLPIYEAHLAEQAAASKILTEKFQTADNWLQKHLQIAEVSAKTAKENLSDHLAGMSRDIFPHLKGEIADIQPNRYENESLRDWASRLLKKHPEKGWGLVGLLGTSVATYALGTLELPIIGPIGPWIPPAVGLISGAIFSLAGNPNEPPPRETATKDKSQSNDPDKADKIRDHLALVTTATAALGAIAGKTLDLNLPGASQVVAPLVAGIAGYNAPRITTGYADKLVFPQVQVVFNNLFNFGRSPIVRHRLFVDSLAAINTANRKA